MNIDAMLSVLNSHGVRFILIGGANFFLRHLPVTTYDVDVWIEDSAENRARCVDALRAMNAAWGRSEDDWGPVSARKGDWLAIHPVFCMVTDHGPLDVFRFVDGLPDWSDSLRRAQPSKTPDGTPFHSLSDGDMIACQLALPEEVRKLDRIRHLRQGGAS